MIYIKWLLMAVAGTVMDLLGLFVVPIALLQAGITQRLPGWAQWWDNDREPFGDTVRRAELEQATTWARKFLLRWHWLAVRNPSNNFGYNVIGFPQTPEVVYTQSGNPNTSDQNQGGWKTVQARAGSHLVAFEFYLIVPYGSRCLRVRLGWKIDHNLIPDLAVTNGAVAQLVNVINPFMTYTGR